MTFPLPGPGDPQETSLQLLEAWAGGDDLERALQVSIISLTQKRDSFQCFGRELYILGIRALFMVISEYWMLRGQTGYYPLGLV